MSEDLAYYSFTVGNRPALDIIDAAESLDLDPATLFVEPIRGVTVCFEHNADAVRFRLCCPDHIAALVRPIMSPEVAATIEVGTEWAEALALVDAMGLIDVMLTERVDIALPLSIDPNLLQNALVEDPDLHVVAFAPLKLRMSPPANQQARGGRVVNHL